MTLDAVETSPRPNSGRRSGGAAPSSDLADYAIGERFDEHDVVDLHHFMGTVLVVEAMVGTVESDPADVDRPDHERYRTLSINRFAAANLLIPARCKPIRGAFTRN